MFGLDIETKSLVEGHPEYALQPWRVREGKAEISLIAIGTAAKVRFITLDDMKRLKGGQFICWNTIFDCAFLYAAGVDVDRFEWYDAMTMTKWLENCQDNDTMGYSLAAVAKRHLKDWQYYSQFLKLKATEADQSHDKYWEVRAKLDVMATCRIYAHCQTAMLDTAQTERQYHQTIESWKIECGNIVPNAKAWVEGLPTNPKYYDEPIPVISQEMCDIELRLGVCINGAAKDPMEKWVPSPVLRSPKQLAEMLYEKWKLPCTRMTDKGAPATDKAALTYLADKDEKVIEILRWRHLNTRLTKFCQSPRKAAAYLNSNTLHPEPKIFSTYTGRYTYGSKVGKHNVAMALHQIPRGPEVRRMVEAPEGKILVELDAGGQEARLLAEIGDVESMLQVFREGKKTHAVMGAAIAGINYTEFMKRYKAGDESYAGPEGLYYCGKFVGLSMQYRVGAQKHLVMARVQYGLKKDMTTIQRWRALYHSTYPEVKRYWDLAVRKAKSTGYAETLAGRRYYIDKWDKANAWSSESSAINFPIQGSGGDMKNLAITTLHRKHPELTFAFDLHDGIFLWTDKTKEGLQAAMEARETLNNLDYESAWGWKPRIPMPWDLSIGTNWGDMKEI